MRVYEYGARAPVENLDIIRKQFSLAHKYSHALTELEHTRRKKVQEAQMQDTSVAVKTAAVDALAKELADLRQLIKDRRAETKSANTSVANRTKARQMAVQLKEQTTELREIKRAARENDAMKAALKAVDDECSLARKALRAEFAGQGLYWGTYLIIEAAADQAAKEKELPKFRRWNREGTIAVQLQGGLSVEKAMSETDTRLRIGARVDPESVTTRSERSFNRSNKVLVRMRIGTVPGGQAPIWAVVPVLLHRPLPPGGVISWAKLHQRRTADHESWVLQLTVEDSACAPPVDGRVLPDAERGTVGIDVGWRLKANGDLRIAVADCGRLTDELVLPAAMLSKDAHVDELARIRSLNFEKIKPDVVAWCKGREEECCQNAHAWMDPRRIVRLVHELEDEMPGDLFVTLCAFVAQDRHLWQWQEHEREKVRRQRDMQMRLWAIEICRRYSVIKIEKFDLRDIAARGPAEEDTSEGRRLQRLRGFANISRLRQLLVEAAKNRGAVVEEHVAAGTTMMCTLCKHVDTEINAKKSIDVVCPECMATEDQDVRAAVNLRAMPSADALKTHSADLDKRKREMQPMSARQQALHKNKKKPVSSQAVQAA